MARPRRGGTKARVDVSDLDNWEATLRSAAVEIERVARRLEMEYAEKLAEQAKAKAPKSSGQRSRNSVRYGPLEQKIQARRTGTPEGQRGEVSVGTAFYGIFLERGTVNMKRRPFLAPAVRKVRPAFRDEAIREAMRILGQ